MTDCYRIGQFFDNVSSGTKNPSDRTHTSIALDKLTVTGSYPRRLLPTMLKAVQTKIGFLNGFSVTENAKKTTTLFALLILHLESHFVLYTSPKLIV
jgi:hypothetical protein